MRERHKSSLIGEIFSLPSDLHVRSLSAVWGKWNFSMVEKLKLNWNFMHMVAREHLQHARAPYVSSGAVKIAAGAGEKSLYEIWSLVILEYAWERIKIYEDLDTRDLAVVSSLSTKNIKFSTYVNKIPNS